MVVWTLLVPVWGHTPGIPPQKMGLFSRTKTGHPSGACVTSAQRAAQQASVLLLSVALYIHAVAFERGKERRTEGEEEKDFERV